ncbi:hypothetical protein H0H92_008844 [Tricholoma furcatifolium]|nr:hypothetical protein H0H92_008844 [Tricholoma furcatifolium]
MSAIEQGAKVTAHYNSSNKNLRSHLDQYGDDRLQALQADLTIEHSVTQLFSKALSSFGPVQILIVNHGIWPSADQPVVQMSLDQWKSTIDVNLTASFLVCREFLKILQPSSDSLKECASILFIGSTAGKFGEAGHADYSASKSVVYRATATTPLKKVASTSDIANQVVILSSPRISGHVSGEVIVVAGGMEGDSLAYIEKAT